MILKIYDLIPSVVVVLMIRSPCCCTSELVFVIVSVCERERERELWKMSFSDRRGSKKKLTEKSSFQRKKEKSSLFSILNFSQILTNAQHQKKLCKAY